MPTFNDLPIELLEEIVDFSVLLPLPAKERTPVPGLKRLRLVSRRMNEAVSPRMASRFRIWIFERPTPAHCDEICTDLAAGIPTFLQHLIVLNIKMMDFLDVDVHHWSNLLKLLFLASPNIGAVRWTNDPTKLRRYPETFIPWFLRSISSLQNLSELSVLVWDTEEVAQTFPLEPIPQLRTFKILWKCSYSPQQQILSQISCLMPLFRLRSMMLQSLNLRGVIVKANEFKQHLRHFRYLSRLHITIDPSPSAAVNIGEILRTLGDNKIYLTDVLVDAIHHPGVFGYLSSYSTLERLELRPRDQLDDFPSSSGRFLYLGISCTVPITPAAHHSGLSMVTLGGPLIIGATSSSPQMPVSGVHILPHLSAG
ncbi:hypothetical protein NP233_g7171 [Leucocoprinus birnbaumii]|uniref:F-box domain-containing protein n=1 Tax=Leucocoprinus birnbaumii TaxID=56174 RepID=A0AAD5VT08_9AGAR|nr:hypothetical protein NP233_g7171 [Leucocoprinus birnbaumii]